MKRFQFLVEFIKNRRAVGSIVPSGKPLINKMLKTIDFSKPVTIVELGPGTGPLTREVLKRMNSESKLISIETNPKFQKILEALQDSRYTPLHGSAETLGNILEAKNILKPDYILSSLPFSLSPFSLSLSSPLIFL